MIRVQITDTTATNFGDIYLLPEDQARELILAGVAISIGDPEQKADSIDVPGEKEG